MHQDKQTLVIRVGQEKGGGDPAVALLHAGIQGQQSLPIHPDKETLRHHHRQHLGVKSQRCRDLRSCLPERPD